MTLLDSLSNKFKTPTYQAYIGGQPTKIISASWDLGYDIQSSAALVVVNAIPATMAFRQQLEIWAGYDGFTIPAYRGEIENDQRSWFPFDGSIRASGYLRRAQSKHPTELTFSNQNDEEIIEALLPLAGITISAADIHGEGVTDLGTVQPVLKPAGTPIINLINEIDQIFSYKTFDAADGTVFRRRHAGLPSSTAAFTFTEGVNAYKITRRLGSVYDLSNQVNVYGLPQDGITWPTTRLAVNPLVPDPPGFIAFDLRSSLIETQIVASVLAQRLMGEVNGIPDEVEIETWGNPYIQPAMTIAVTSPKNSMSAVHYWVKHIHQEINAAGYTMRIIGERRDGDLGEETGKAPIAQFTYRISKETYEVGGVPTTMYTVTADGSGSWDPDGSPADLTFSWSNNKNADTGTDKVYTTTFTDAQMRAATAPTITLTVNDADPSSAAGSVTKTISIGTDPTNERTLYVAVSGRAEATDDGGETWQTWTPGAGTVISTPPIASASYGLFGLSNGKLMYTADVLLTAPTEAHDFGSQIDCIWVNEIDPDRVTVGCSDGTVHVTNNMTAIAGSTWTQLADFASAVLWLEESAVANGQYRIAMGNQILITYDSFATTGELVNFGADTARAGATSFFANYYSATSADEVKREDGTVITGDATGDIRAIAHHIRDDVLFAVNTAGQSYRKAAGATSLTAKVAIPTPGTVNHMINDGDNQRIFYVAANQGLYKTFDEFGTVVRMRDYTGAGFDGLKVGRASLSLVNPPLNGKRVYVAGRRSDTLAPVFVWTENIYATSPIWTSNVTGLPAVISGEALANAQYFRSDPWNPSTIGYFVAGNNADSNSIEVYKNTSMRSGGTWTKIFDRATLAALAGGAVAMIEEIDLVLSIVTENFIGMMVEGNAAGVGDGNFDQWFVHSHDGGSSWTAVYIADIFASGNAVILGHHDSNVVYVNGSPAGGGAHGIWRSLDHGHTFALREAIDLRALVLPVASNPNDLILYAVSSANNTIKRSINGGDTWTDMTGANSFTRLEILDANLTGIAIALGVDKLGLSTNGASSFTLTHSGAGTVAEGAQGLALLRTGIYYYVRNHATTKIYTSVDWTTFINRTGNFNTAAGSADAIPMDIVPDISS